MTIQPAQRPFELAQQAGTVPLPWPVRHSRTGGAGAGHPPDRYRAARTSRRVPGAPLSAGVVSRRAVFGNKLSPAVLALAAWGARLAGEGLAGQPRRRS